MYLNSKIQGLQVVFYFENKGKFLPTLPIFSWSYLLELKEPLLHPPPYILLAPETAIAQVLCNILQRYYKDTKECTRTKSSEF